MSTCIEKLSHSCGSSDALQVFEDDGEYSGYCFSCNTWVADPYRNQPKNYKPAKIGRSQEDIARIVYETYHLPVKPVRGLTVEALDYFGVKTGVSEVDGETVVSGHFPYDSNGETVAYKNVILDGKKIYSVGALKEADLFGWYKARQTGSNKLIITEGEWDAVAMWQMITKSQKGGAYEEYIPAVISIKSGAGSAAKGLSIIAAEAEKLFKEIILAFDMDEAGQEAAHNVVKEVFPNAKIAYLPANDPNACLLEGRSKSCVKAVVWNSIVPKNTSIKSVRELEEEARQPPKFGWSYPWDGLTELTKGIRKGEVITLAAAVKMGKSHTAKQIAAHLILHENVNTFMVSPEEAPAMTLKGMAGIVAEAIFNDPSVEFDVEKFDRALDKLDDKLFVLSSYQLLNWESLKADIKYAVVADQCELIIIDPISNLIASMDSREANEFLNLFMPELAKMALDYDVAVILTSHLKATDAGEGHEEGGKVLLKQLTGSRAIIRSSNLLLGLEGDLSNEKEEVRRMRHLRIMADRNLGATGVVDLWWNENTHKLEEVNL